MSRALEKSIRHSDMIASTAFDATLQHKQAGGVIDFSSPGLTNCLSGWQEQSMYDQKYNLFHGWIYSAVNVLASEGAGQSACVAKLKGSSTKGEEKEKLRNQKAFQLSRMTKGIRSKVAASHELEILEEHLLKDLMEKPNPIQDKWQFVYTFISNLCLTGWSYVVAGEHEGRLEMYALPTTWVKPIHDPSSFDRFEVKNPKAVGTEPVVLDRDQVGFAYLPNPSDPLCALAPAAAQMRAVRIDDHIQTSQDAFFDNGIFPSALVTVGKMPYMDTEGRPVLMGNQRRQITSALKKLYSGPIHQGEPIILDGMVESVERFQFSQNEMGWDKSEEKVRTRILSAFAVHPYILGDNVRVGGYAQVANIEKRFYKRVNTYLDMLGNLLTNLFGSIENERLLLWYEKTEVSDPSLEQSLNLAMRDKGDIGRNEMRAFAGYSPVEEKVSERSELLETVGGMNGTVAIMTAMGQGVISREAAIQMLITFLQVSDKEAEAMVGPKAEKKEEPALPPVPAIPAPEEETEENEEIEDAVEELRRVEALLEKAMDPEQTVKDVLESVCPHC